MKHEVHSAAGENKAQIGNYNSSTSFLSMLLLSKNWTAQTETWAKMKCCVDLVISCRKKNKKILLGLTKYTSSVLNPERKVHLKALSHLV